MVLCYAAITTNRASQHARLWASLVCHCNTSDCPQYCPCAHPSDVNKHQYWCWICKFADQTRTHVLNACWGTLCVSWTKLRRHHDKTLIKIAACIQQHGFDQGSASGALCRSAKMSSAGSATAWSIHLACDTHQFLPRVMCCLMLGAIAGLVGQILATYALTTVTIMRAYCSRSAAFLYSVIAMMQCSMQWPDATCWCRQIPMLIAFQKYDGSTLWLHGTLKLKGNDSVKLESSVRQHN